MATIQNYRDVVLQATSPRLILVPSNYISLSGTGNTFEVRGANTHPATIIINAVPHGHIINQTVTFSLVATTGHTLSVSGNTAVITGSVNGSDIITVKAAISYQGLDYESTYTINKIAASSFTSYEVTTSSGSIAYDPNTTSFIPTSISIEGVYSDNGITFSPYSGRFTIHVSSDGGYTWGTAQYTSSGNESSYTYGLTGVTSTTNRVRFRLHNTGETPSDSNVLDSTIIPVIVYGYTGSGDGGVNGRSVYLYTGSASTVSVYGNDGYLASSSNATNPVLVAAVTTGFVGTQWYRWLLDEAVVSDWSTTNTTYSYTREYLASNMPDILRIEVGDGYSGSSVFARDYVTFYYAGSGSGQVIAALSNKYHTVPFEGTVGDYSNSGTLFWVYEEDNILTFNSIASTYPAEGNNGKYNVEVTYTNIDSGGTITGTSTTIGSVPDHVNMTANQATVTFTFRVRKLDGSTIAEIYEYQVIYKSSAAGSTVVIGSTGSNTFFTGSNLPNIVDFSNLEQVFWPGYYGSTFTSNQVVFAKHFAGQTLSASYIGSEAFEVLSGTPTNPLTLVQYDGSGIGTACDPIDHPVLFGNFVYV